MIRRARTEDAAKMAAIEGAAAHHPWSERSVRRALSRPYRFGLVVAAGGVLDGHLLASAVAGEGEILTLAIHPRAQRTGLATKLLHRCADHWMEVGVDVAFLEVREANEAGRALYATAGWLPSHTRSDYYGPGEHAQVLTWRRPCSS